MTSAIKESKIAATDRLRREDRWEEAQQYRDEIRKKLLADGMKRAQARDASWETMLEKYPRIADATGSEALDSDLPPEWFAAGTPDLAADFLWVYNQLGNPHVQLPPYLRKPNGTFRTTPEAAHLPC